LPGSSEALLIYKLQNASPIFWLLLSVTFGNVLGSLLTFYMGLGGNWLVHKRWLGISEQSLAKAETHFQRYGVWSLLFAWLPVVGDPLCLAAGLLKVNLWLFLLLVGIGKTLRYLIIAGVFA